MCLNEKGRVTSTLPSELDVFFVLSGNITWHLPVIPGADFQDNQHEPFKS
jgi:hypothetical protein